MTWDDRTPGTWMLTQFHDPGTNGACTELGEFSSYRSAVEAARVIVGISRLRGEFTATFCRSHKREGASVDGRTSPIKLDGPGDYTGDIELRLRDGRVMWLSDLEDELRQAHVAVAALEQVGA